MARPERNNVDYFPYYCDEGKKMYYIEETYGNDGFATFHKILKLLAVTDYHYLDLSKKTSEMFVSSKCKISTSTLENIINDLVELGKFDSVLWKENKIIWCQDFIDSIQDAYSKRKNKCIHYEGLLQLLEGLGVRKQLKSTPKPIKCTLKGSENTQSIVKYTKVKESKVNIPEFIFFKEYALTLKPNVDENELYLKYNSWKENNWRDGYDKEIKNWKTKISNTLPYLKENKKTENENTKKIGRQTIEEINSTASKWAKIGMHSSKCHE